MREPIFPSAIRRALLDDHIRLRRLLRDLEEVAGRMLAGEPVSQELRATALMFRRALDAHNTIEEAHLKPLLQSVDAWGDVRVDQMLIDHLEEHKSLLLALSVADAMRMAAAVPSFAEDLRAHMELEEKTFLSGEVLRDDFITTGPTS